MLYNIYTFIYMHIQVYSQWAKDVQWNGPKRGEERWTRNEANAGWLLAHWADVQIRRDVSVDYVRARHTRWSPNFGTTSPGECHAQRDTSPALSSTSAWSFLLNGWLDTSYARVRDAPCPTASSFFLSFFFSHLFVYLLSCLPRVCSTTCARGYYCLPPMSRGVFVILYK